MRYVVFVAGIVAWLAAVQISGLATDDDQPNARGRLESRIVADYVNVDEKGAPLPGGGAIERVCEFDALVDIERGKIVNVERVGDNRVEIGELVIGADYDIADRQVYRDRSGQLRVGCAPESWERDVELEVAP